MTEQTSALVVEVKEMYKRQICWCNSSLYQQLSLSAHPLLLHLTVTMKSIIFFVFTTISLGLTKRHKPVLPARVPATSLNMSDTARPSDSLIDKEVRKTKAILDTETWFRPCDCGGPGWEKIAFYDFSQQECPHNFARHYGQYNDTSCEAYYVYHTCRGGIFSSLPLPVEGRSYSSVCGRVRGHGLGGAFVSAINCIESLEQTYVSGVSLTHGPAGTRKHIWTFAAALADGDPNTGKTTLTCGCSNTNINWTHPHPRMWEMTISAIVIEREAEEMKMMIYGMGKDVAQAAVAVNGTTHLTSASTSITPHLRTWKSDSMQFPTAPIFTLPLCPS